MTPEIGVAAATGGVVLGLLTWQTLVARRAIVALEARLARQADALALLTETSESGFAAIAHEMSRRVRTARAQAQGQPTGRRSTATTKRRPAAAHVPVGERMSEVEARLRLELARQAAHRERR